MSEFTLIIKIDEADLNAELKTTFRDLVIHVEQALPHLPDEARIRLYNRSTHLISEVTEPTVEIHWWEASLDLLVKAAQRHRESGVAVADAAQRVRPLRSQHLGPYGPATLREITAETVRDICLLSDTLTMPKRRFVAPNALSLAQAHFNPYVWFCGVWAGKAPIGFLMLKDNDEAQEYFLWRFMIAEPYHRRGYGRQAIDRLVEYVKTRPGATELLVSCGQGKGSPEEFYRACVFKLTGKKRGIEIVLRLELT